jgi:hypothetical protein
VYTIMTGLCLIAQIFFGEETYFNRKIPLDERPVRQLGFGGKMRRLIGIEQWRDRKQRSTSSQAMMRPVLVLIKPTVFLSTIYYLLTFAWVVGINTTLSFYFTPIVAAILGEIVGHWLHDAIARYLTKRSEEKKLEPEFRLLAIAISTPFIVSGLVVLGFALENGWHYMIAALGWGLYVFVSCLAYRSLNDQR